MEIENQSTNGTDDSIPKKDEYEAVLKTVSSTLGSDFLSFDTNGLEFISNMIIPAIPTGIKNFVFLLFCVVL